jgi:hypothetical protein
MINRITDGSLVDEYNFRNPSWDSYLLSFYEYISNFSLTFESTIAGNLSI